MPKKGKAPANDRPEHSITVDTYAEFRDDIEAFAKGTIKFLTLLGGAGVGKSETARRYLKEAVTVDTKLSAFDFYGKLYENRDSIFIIDDVPDIFRNADSIALLKALAAATSCATGVLA